MLDVMYCPLEILVGHSNMANKTMVWWLFNAVCHMYVLVSLDNKHVILSSTPPFLGPNRKRKCRFLVKKLLRTSRWCQQSINLGAGGGGGVLMIPHRQPRRPWSWPCSWHHHTYSLKEKRFQIGPKTLQDKKARVLTKYCWQPLYILHVRGLKTLKYQEYIYLHMHA